MKVNLSGRGAVAIALCSSAKRSLVGSTMTLPFTAMSSSVGLPERVHTDSIHARHSLKGTRMELAMWHRFFNAHELPTVFAVTSKRDT